MSVAKSVGGSGIVSAERSSWDLIGINVIVLGDCSLDYSGFDRKTERDLPSFDAFVWD